MAIGVSGRLRADGSIDADVVLAGAGRGLFRDGGDGRGGFGGFPGRGFHGPDGVDDSAIPDASPTTAS